MDPLALTAEALREPWRLWTGHFVHYGWGHSLANLAAMAVPVVLASGRDRGRLLFIAFLAAPLLSLLLLPALGAGQYRGGSGLACVLWVWVGLRLAARRESCAPGLLLLGGLALKLFLESALGSCFQGAHPDWQTLSPAHAWGALLGLGLALAELPIHRPHGAHRI